MRYAVFAILLTCHTNLWAQGPSHSLRLESAVSVQGPSVGLGYTFRHYDFFANASTGLTFVSWLLPAGSVYVETGAGWMFYDNGKHALAVPVDASVFLVKNRVSSENSGGVRSSFVLSPGFLWDIKLGERLHLGLNPRFMVVWDPYFPTHSSPRQFNTILRPGMKVQMGWRI